MATGLAAQLSFAQAQSLDGYCLDLGAEGCTDRFLPFRGNEIDFCEETCRLTNPVGVRGIDGVLLDAECLSDSMPEMEGRVLILYQTDWEGRRHISWIDRQRTMPIVPCR